MSGQPAARVRVPEPGGRLREWTPARHDWATPLPADVLADAIHRHREHVA